MEEQRHSNLKNAGVPDYPKIAARLYEKGFEPIPIAPNQKYPTLKGWPDIRLPIKPWPKGHGIGLRTGQLSAVDVDVYSPRVVDDLLRCFDGLEILTRVGQPPKTLVPILCPEVAGKLLSDQWADDNGVINRVEVLSFGQQFVAYGVHPNTKKPYRWPGDLLSHTPPTVPIRFIDDLFLRFNELASGAGWENISAKTRGAHATCRVRRANYKGGGAGAIYNRSCVITDCLKEYGWRRYKGNYWTRPGKKTGVSAHVLDTGTVLVWTSSTCLEPERSYDCFGLLTYYEYNGDFKAAAKAVWRGHNAES